MSAVRNLNGQDIRGRPLRIDLADSDPLLEGKTTTRGEIEGGYVTGDNLVFAKPPAGGSASTTQKVPAGVPIPPGSSALDVISQVLATIRPAQLMEVMGQMKVCFFPLLCQTELDMTLYCHLSQWS